MFGQDDNGQDNTNVANQLIDDAGTGAAAAHAQMSADQAAPNIPPADQTQPAVVAPEEPRSSAASVAATDIHSPANTVDDLVSIKQQALGQLTPLLGHLEQNAEEKFRTTMMMIQASDDQSLIKNAYEAAQAITDEKTRAQALLDVVNEINYFTQNKSE